MQAYTRQQYQGALNRAKTLGGANAVQQISKFVFAVKSSNGKDGYIVRVRNDYEEYYCSCPAGKHEYLCKHSACVWLYLVANNRLKEPKNE